MYCFFDSYDTNIDHNHEDGNRNSFLSHHSPLKKKKEKPKSLASPSVALLEFTSLRGRATGTKPSMVSSTFFLIAPW